MKPLIPRYPHEQMPGLIFRPRWFLVNRFFAVVGVAGAMKAKRGGRVVCIVTDSGLKSNLMLEGFRERIVRVGDDAALERFMAGVG